MMLWAIISYLPGECLKWRFISFPRKFGTMSKKEIEIMIWVLYVHGWKLDDSPKVCSNFWFPLLLFGLASYYFYSVHIMRQSRITVPSWISQFFLPNNNQIWHLFLWRPGKEIYLHKQWDKTVGTCNITQGKNHTIILGKITQRLKPIHRELLPKLFYPPFKSHANKMGRKGH